MVVTRSALVKESAPAPIVSITPSPTSHPVRSGTKRRRSDVGTQRKGSEGRAKHPVATQEADTAPPKRKRVGRSDPAHATPAESSTPSALPQAVLDNAQLIAQMRCRAAPSRISALAPVAEASSSSSPSLEQISHLLDAKLNNLFDQQIGPDLHTLAILTDRNAAQLVAAQKEQRSLRSSITALERLIAGPAPITEPQPNRAGHATLSDPNETAQRQAGASQAVAQTSTGVDKTSGLKPPLPPPLQPKSYMERIQEIHDLATKTYQTVEMMAEVQETLDNNTWEINDNLRDAARDMAADVEQRLSWHPNIQTLRSVEAKLEELRTGVAGVVDKMNRNGWASVHSSEVEGDDAMDWRMDNMVAAVRGETVSAHRAARRKARKDRAKFEQMLREAQEAGAERDPSKSSGQKVAEWAKSVEP